ncbi:MAG: hypothetical protein M2R45_00075 [Verrucomicrobia subdivision 3 bacterium]|nr:hypothetical protein [Limisphaerales bacterium]MCS1412467.1 hypothetical protein [Limisphaerales bacterium]
MLSDHKQYLAQRRGQPCAQAGNFAPEVSESNKACSSALCEDSEKSVGAKIDFQIKNTSIGFFLTAPPKSRESI